MTDTTITAAGKNAPIAVVTGGAGSIGQAICRTLAQDGYRICVVDVAVDHLESEPWFAGQLAFTGDISRESTVESFFSWLAPQGGLTVLVNAAGISPKGATGKLTHRDITEDGWHRVLDVNALAPFLMTKHAAPLFPRDGSASVVNIISIASRMASSGLPSDAFPPIISSALHYSASKAALRNLTISFSRELASARVRVNDVAPGFIATEMTKNIPQEEKDVVLRQVPLGRPGTPQDIADAVSFLVSPRASYMTGATLDVNGGWMPS